MKTIKKVEAYILQKKLQEELASSCSFFTVIEFINYC